MSETTTPHDELLADVEEAMHDVVDPELGINVMDLGLVYGLEGRARRDGSGCVDRHDAHLGGLPVAGRHRGPVAQCARRRRPGRRAEDQLGVEPAVGRTRSPTTGASNCAPWASRSRTSVSTRISRRSAVIVFAQNGNGAFGLEDREIDAVGVGVAVQA